MAIDLVPSPFWRFPVSGGFWNDEDDMTVPTHGTNSVSIAEDDEHVYVEVALPGIDPKEVEITFDKGVLWVKGEVKEEEKKKKYYRKAVGSFSYRVSVPGEIDATNEPEAQSKHGVMTVTFRKSPKTQPKKITVKD